MVICSGFLQPAFHVPLISLAPFEQRLSLGVRSHNLSRRGQELGDRLDGHVGAFSSPFSLPQHHHKAGAAVAFGKACMAVGM